MCEQNHLEWWTAGTERSVPCGCVYKRDNKQMAHTLNILNGVAKDRVHVSYGYQYSRPSLNEQGSVERFMYSLWEGILALYKVLEINPFQTQMPVVTNRYKHRLKQNLLVGLNRLSSSPIYFLVLWSRKPCGPCSLSHLLSMMDRLADNVAQITPCLHDAQISPTLSSINIRNR